MLKTHKNDKRKRPPSPNEKFPIDDPPKPVDPDEQEKHKEYV